MLPNSVMSLAKLKAYKIFASGLTTMKFPGLFTEPKHLFQS